MRRIFKASAAAIALSVAGVLVGAAPAQAGVVDAVGEVAEAPNLCITVINQLGPVNGAIGCTLIVVGRVGGTPWHLIGDAGTAAGYIAEAPGLCLAAINTLPTPDGAIGCTFIVVGRVGSAFWSLTE